MPICSYTGILKHFFDPLTNIQAISGKDIIP